LVQTLDLVQQHPAIIGPDPELRFKCSVHCSSFGTTPGRASAATR